VETGTPSICSSTHPPFIISVHPFINSHQVVEGQENKADGSPALEEALSIWERSQMQANKLQMATKKAEQGAHGSCL
jgi:hypothetical protein